MPNNDDDDKIIRHKISAVAEQVEETGKKPITLKLWIVVAIALVAFVLGTLF